MRYEFDLQFGIPQEFELGAITFDTESFLIYLKDSSKVIKVRKYNRGRPVFRCLDSVIRLFWEYIFLQWDIPVHLLIEKHHCLVQPHLSKYGWQDHFLATGCTNCIPKKCHPAVIWRKASNDLLVQLYKQKALCADDAMTDRYEVALQLGFWLREWDKREDIFHYLRAYTSDSYFSILDDQRNLLTLIRKFLCYATFSKENFILF